MQPAQWDVVILKPTCVFSRFLSSQLGADKNISSEFMQTDNTAYLMQKQENDEQTIDEIERHFNFMFRHEICRWLGADTYRKFESSFLDFLCCFKFELHSHMMVLEPELEAGRQLLRVRPRKTILQWLKGRAADNKELSTILEQVSLANILENSTIVVKNFEQLSSIKPFLKENYQQIYSTEMQRMCDDSSLWPTVNNYEDFCNYFAIDIHTQLKHLH